MADIVFNKDGNKWVAEFEVSADFNLHIEKPQIGYLYMQQRSTSGKWDSVHKFQVADSDYIVDYDFTALVYPKQIRLVSEYAPTMCALTSEGDVIEIKSQSKEVEITQNGEMSVTPDDGFAYLSSVNVKTNVPQQGGGESGGGGCGVSPDALILEPNGWYWKFDDINRDGKEVSQILTLLMEMMNIRSGVLKNKAMNESYVYDPQHIGYYIKSIATDVNRTIIAISEAKGARDIHLNLYDSLYDMASAQKPGLTESDLESMMNQEFGLTRITKEEFYNLES